MRPTTPESPSEPGPDLPPEQAPRRPARDDRARLVLKQKLAALVGEAHVSVAAIDRQAYARDLWPRSILSVRAGETAPFPPEGVVWPATTDEVAAVVRLAAAEGIPVVPFGAGSGVCGGGAPTEAGIVVDLKRMDRVEWVDPEDGLCAVEPGIIGQHFEDYLNRRGLTLGHFPSSIYCSTVGGWLAARSAGQMSTRYGKIEDLVESVQFVSGAGEVMETLAYPPSGPDWTQVLVGSEGTLGIITRGLLRVHRMPEVRRFRGIAFSDVQGGMQAIRALVQEGYAPAVVRLYDELDSILARMVKGEGSGWKKLLGKVAEPLGELGAALARQGVREALTRPGPVQKLLSLLPKLRPGGCLLIVGWEGAARRTDALAQAGVERLRALGGQDLGASPGERWFEHRYGVSYRQSPIFDSGAFCDTMEVAATWDRLDELYQRVHEALAEHALVGAHFSHAYPEGCSIYFTFAAAAPTLEQSEARYDTLWRAGLEAALKAGGTISHHHGVGLSKASFMPQEHPGGFGVLRAVKSVLDPRGVMNPTKLGLDGPSAANRGAGGGR